MTMKDIFNQAPFQCRMDWGLRGTYEAADRGDIVIIVDVLSFSSTVVSAVHFGTTIYPFPMEGDVSEFGKSVDAEILFERKEAKELGKPSLSPVSFNETYKGNKFVLSSLNGATCARISQKVPALLIGSLLNASAVAKVAEQLQKKNGASITVIACGEKWDNKRENGAMLRPCIEDYLGAGAILSELNGTKSPEAKVCVSAFENSQKELNELIWGSSSGRELREKGFAEDVTHSSQLNAFREVPTLVQDDLDKVFFKEFAASAKG